MTYGVKVTVTVGYGALSDNSKEGVAADGPCCCSGKAKAVEGDDLGS